MALQAVDASLWSCPASLPVAQLALDVACAGTAASARPQPAPMFRSRVNLMLVDVVVRDRSGAVVKGPHRDDFELLEDGKPQQMVTFAFEEITTTATPVAGGSTLAAAKASAAAAATTAAVAPGRSAGRAADV